LAIPAKRCICSGNNEQSVFGAIEYNYQPYGTGRTDTGVHAEMYAHFDFETPIDVARLVHKPYLPKILWFMTLFQFMTKHTPF
jgi:tRNA U38,U39,U40 pseudouridine synthase TruA